VAHGAEARLVGPDGPDLGPGIASDHAPDPRIPAMAKAYWIATYRAINDPDKMAAYAALAKPALEAAGGTFIARGMPAAVYEQGISERVTLIEWDSTEQSIAAHDGAAYQEALAALGDGAERDIRIVEGV